MLFQIIYGKGVEQGCLAPFAEESPSADADGVAQAAAHLDTYCGALGLSTKKYIYEHAGPSLAAWTKEGALPGVA